MSRLRDSIFILRKKSSIFLADFFKLYMNFNQVKHFYSDQGMIENSYLKSHIFFTKKNWYFFFHNSDENSNEDIIILLFFKY